MGVKINRAVSWCLNIANDNSYGYDQTHRWGPNYDCSSFLIQSWENAGVPVKTKGASYTGNMVSVFKNCGFTDVTSKVNRATGEGIIKGDVCWVNGHCEMCSRPGYLVGAHINENGGITGGQSGDQTGNEISERTYYNNPWTIVLRYDESSGTSVSKSEVISSNNYLSLNQMKPNARYIYQELSKKGWTLNAIAGFLGNVQTESNINPGIWQSLKANNTSLGFGLVQWTPATKLIEWANANGYDYKDIDTQLKRIQYEMDNGIQYYSTPNYPESFYEFTRSTKTPEYLAYAFLNNYERPANRNQPNRKSQARYWYDYLIDFSTDDSGGSGIGIVKPIRPVKPKDKRKKFKFHLYRERRKEHGF